MDHVIDAIDRWWFAAGRRRRSTIDNYGESPGIFRVTCDQTGEVFECTNLLPIIRLVHESVVIDTVLGTPRQELTYSFSWKANSDD